ncbi:phage tail protein [Selenomonas sp. FC4001]|uniref:glycine-rich domain-containing protein n=1 Tax=Selenomonas sp. FC4001 TaxID=1408313 RepID=UPI0005641331|nr:phage tail protein [Selenomonas sp. FC4001]
MSNYPNTTLTNAGQDLIAESIAEGKALIFTKVELGDGNLAAGQSISTLTALISSKMNVPLSSGSADNGQAKLRFAVGNSGLEEGFFAREVGVFAKAGADGVETLYAYTNGGNYVDFIPDQSRPIDDQIMDVYIVTGNAAEVQIQVDSAAYLTVSDLTEHNDDAESHKDVYGRFIRQRQTDYELKDVVYLPSLGAKLYLECTSPGTTSSGDLVITSPAIGNTVTDGTVTWTIRAVASTADIPAPVDISGKADITGANMVYHKDIITTSGTYTAPLTGLYKITVKGGGGGGGGALHDSTNNGGGGGGEGGTTIAYISMTAEDTANVIIGGGGTGGLGGQHKAGNGGDSSVTYNGNTYTGGGGRGGNQKPDGTQNITMGGLGGTGTMYGEAGQTAGKTISSSEAAPGGTGGGTGGAPGMYSGAGINAIANTGGGGGGAGGISSYTGGDGADGYVWFEYYTP